MRTHTTRAVTVRRAMPHMLVLEHVSPATRLLEKRRQMFEVQEVLDAQKAGFDRKEEIFKRQEDGLKKKDLDLQESLIKFSKFLQENDSKINRAEKKGREEIALRQQKDAEIADLERVLDELKTKFDTVNDVVVKHVKYQRYLESVVEEDSDLQEVGELLNRHGTLVATNTDLKQQQKVNSEEMEHVRADMNALVKRRTDEILNKNNQVARLKKQLEAIRLRAADQEALKDSALQITSQNTLEYGQVCPRYCDLRDQLSLERATLRAHAMLHIARHTWSRARQSKVPPRCARAWWRLDYGLRV